MRNQLGALIALALCIHVAEADKLSDFRDAVSQEGCDSIPYGDLRSNCRSQQNEVHPWCDGDRGPVSCDVNGTRDLQGKVEREQRNLDALKDRRRDIDDKRSHAADDAEKAKWTAELESIDREIEASQKRIDGLRDDFSKRKDFVDNAIYTLNKCIDSRVAVMNVFAYATDKVRGENDEDIKPYAQQLRDKYPVHISGHQTQIDSRKNALEICKKERP